MEEIFYTKDNYWVIIENDIATIGIPNNILDEMNIINYVELPSIGSFYDKNDLIGLINYDEDEKLDLYAPFTGEIADINESIIDNCEQLFSRDTENNWLFRVYISSKDELEDELISEEEYRDFLDNDLD